MQKEDKKDQVKEEEVTVSNDANRLNVGQNLFGGCLPKEIYDTILARKLTVLGSFQYLKENSEISGKAKKSQAY